MSNTDYQVPVSGGVVTCIPGQALATIDSAIPVQDLVVKFPPTPADGNAFTLSSNAAVADLEPVSGFAITGGATSMTAGQSLGWTFSAAQGAWVSI